MRSVICSLFILCNLSVYANPYDSLDVVRDQLRHMLHKESADHTPLPSQQKQGFRDYLRYRKIITHCYLDFLQGLESYDIDPWINTIKQFIEMPNFKKVIRS